ncbi:hypothetical protein [Paenibacillus sp. YYML68]|uniref:hypothetical protein n=1 Tax=Paenibacillus sp. YYML68 TaxID=2909250 RepID=UPI002490CFFF|nr:hypothetical protein [Paenibacillus sp. YYML68]
MTLSTEHQLTLLRIAEQLSSHGLEVGLGGSSMLAAHGLAEQPRDLDLLVALPDADAAHELLQQLGRSERLEPKEPYCSRFFVLYTIGRVEVDLIGGFGIRHDAGIYRLDWRRRSDDAVLQLATDANHSDDTALQLATDVSHSDNAALELAVDTDRSVVPSLQLTAQPGRSVSVTLTPLEDWYVLYLLLPGQGAAGKAARIERYWREQRGLRPDVLRAALHRELPPHVRQQLEQLLAELGCC